MLTGLPLSQVPSFCALFGEGQWFTPFAAWLNDRGLAPLASEFDDDSDMFDWATRFGRAVPWIATGPIAGSGLLHSVVYVGPSLFHDPSPDPRPLRRIESACFVLPMLRSFAP
jgi:hypothetical protein